MCNIWLLDEVAMTTLLLKVMAELRLDYVLCVLFSHRPPVAWQSIERLRLLSHIFQFRNTNSFVSASNLNTSPTYSKLYSTPARESKSLFVS